MHELEIISVVDNYVAHPRHSTRRLLGVSGRKVGRVDAREITCFVNNVGAGLQFAALGALILKKAGSMNLGIELPGEWFSQNVHP